MNYRFAFKHEIMSNELARNIFGTLMVILSMLTIIFMFVVIAVPWEVTTFADFVIIIWGTLGWILPSLWVFKFIFIKKLTTSEIILKELNSQNK